MKRINFSLMLLFGLAFFLLIGTTVAFASTSTPLAENSLLQDNKLIKSKQAAAPPFLHIATTDTAGSVQQALTDHGVAFDIFSGSDWSGIDLSGYNTVVIGMDGGQVNTASVQNVADFAANGGRLIIIGGSAWLEWVNAVNTYLLLNDTGNYNWVVSSIPHLTVTNPGHGLAAGLPMTYNFVNSGAAYYQIKSTDPDISVAAVNGDGYDAIFSKTINTGMLIWFINSAYDGYWGDPADYAVFSTIIANAIDFEGAGPGPAPRPIPTISEWGMIIFSLLLAGSAIWMMRRRQIS